MCKLENPEVAGVCANVQIILIIFNVNFWRITIYFWLSNA